MTEEQTKRTKKSPNYALEQFQVGTDGVMDAWVEIKAGFVSPEKALEYAEKEKLNGTFRVVRIASPEYTGELTVPDPVYSLKKTGEDKPKKRRGRKPKTEPAAVPAPPVSEDDISKRSLEQIDASAKNLKEGVAGDPVAIPEDEGPEDEALSADEDQDGLGA